MDLTDLPAKTAALLRERNCPAEADRAAAMSIDELSSLAPTSIGDRRIRNAYIELYAEGQVGHHGVGIPPKRARLRF